MKPTLATATVANDPDDPAIWVSKSSPNTALILGTDKVETSGALYVFGLSGAIKQVITPLDRPNNVDVEYGLMINGKPVDIAVVTERKQHRLRIYGIPADGGFLYELTPGGVPVLSGETGQASEPMGIGLYRRPSDGAIFAIVAPKTGGRENYLWQYRLDDNGTGGVQATLVRRFGAFSGLGPTPGEAGEIEAVAVDDAMGFVYYSDERFGIRKYAADPAAADAARELAAFGTDGYLGDREGLAIFETGPTSGFIVSSDQVPGGTRVMLYPREGTTAGPHAHPRVGVVPTVSDETDGLDVVSASLPGFPGGLLVMMNSTARNFLLYSFSFFHAS